MNNPIKTILYQLYLLQLEEYDLGHYLMTVKKVRRNIPNETRKGIVWTPKMTTIGLLAFFLYCLTCGIVGLMAFGISSSLLIFSLSFFLCIVLFAPFFHLDLVIASLMLSPFEQYAKGRVIDAARRKLTLHSNLKIIGIAGSYGKTTMKEVLYKILSQKYNTLKTGRSINTPLGISQEIISDLTTRHEIYIVEMGEYYKGDIAAICGITKPDIAVVTGINEAHLEKMGSLDTTTEAIFEIVEHAKPDATIVLNMDDERVAKNPSPFTLQPSRLIKYSIKGGGDLKVSNVMLREETLETSFSITTLGTLKVKILGEYIIGDIVGAVQIARLLDCSIDEIKRGIESIQPVPHRLEPIMNKQTGVLVIDDSYNGNPDGVGEAIKLLSKFKKRRKVYVTPGLVETGEKNAEIHYNIGKTLSDVADVVVLIKNSATPHIAKGLTEKGFNEKNIVWFESAKEAHARMGEVTRLNDVVLFQNDWPDNYL